jgi:hypothetical protein
MSDINMYFYFVSGGTYCLYLRGRRISQTRRTSGHYLLQPDFFLAYSWKLKMEARRLFETSVDVQQLTRRHIREARNLVPLRIWNLTCLIQSVYETKSVPFNRSCMALTGEQEWHMKKLTHENNYTEKLWKLPIFHHRCGWYHCYRILYSFQLPQHGFLRNGSNIKHKTTLKNAVFWDVTPYGSCKNRHFGGTYFLHHQGDKNQPARNNVSSK